LIIETRSEIAMTASILDGRALARTVRGEIKAAVAAFEAVHHWAPSIAVVRAGEDPASVSYARMIQRSFERAGMGSTIHARPGDVTQAELVALVQGLSADGAVQGIMIQEPLPRTVDEGAVKEALAPEKDVDGVHVVNSGRLAQVAPVGRPTGVGAYFVPATPAGGLEILKRHGTKLEGKHAVVVGRSNIVGKPMALLLLRENATVTICHSRTPDLGAVCRQGDILCAAVGRARIITADMVKSGAVVIDFGFNQWEEQWVGDVDFEAVTEVASAVTPVPGGTGSMTNVMLMRNVLEAAERQVER
jgi:methylenetetrahydrofolate dehydrogenase (NADP+)/methenyltetrahydrofolate cyclohydrolase